MSIQFKIEDVEEIISTLETTAQMMEPYYVQCGGQDEAYSLVEKLKKLLPYTDVKTTIYPAYCKLCNKTFEFSRKRLKLDQHAQDTAVSNHLISEHGIHDYKERKRQRQRCIVKVERVEYKTYAEFLEQQ